MTVFDLREVVVLLRPSSRQQLLGDALSPRCIERSSRTSMTPTSPPSSCMVIGDHLLRDVLTGDRSGDLGRLATASDDRPLQLRLSSSWAQP